MNGSVITFATRMHASRPFGGTVLDVGAYDVNGSLSGVLPVTHRVDMRPGPGVDEVCDATALLERFGPASWDHVVSAEMLEHAQDWKDCLRNMWGVLRPGGMFLLTMASTQKGRHAYPDDYWRFHMPEFESIFLGNEVLGSFAGQTSIGICVVKSTDELNLNVEPIKVP